MVLAEDRKALVVTMGKKIFPSDGFTVSWKGGGAIIPQYDPL